MSDPFLGEIRPVGFNYPPSKWANCDGQIVAISQNPALFSVLGTNFGGNGTSTFALPDLRGRTSFSFGQGPGLGNYDVGATIGTENVTLTLATLPAHTHSAGCTGGKGQGNTTNPTNAVWANTPGADTPYANSADSTMSPNCTDSFGGSLPHNNMQPYLVINFIIALQGIFPERD